MLSYSKLEHIYEQFCLHVQEESGEKFVSFENPFVMERESYKYLVRREAYSQLNVNLWRMKDIGSGKIISHVKNAVDKNVNLLRNYNRYGKNSREDRSLYDENIDVEIYEKVLYDFYKSKTSDEVAFNRLLEIVGRIYPYMSFLFFIKNEKRYLPIAPDSFDFFFKIMRLEFRSAGKCSWENYQTYLSLIKEIQQFLNCKDEIIDEVTLLDTHSFVWIYTGYEKSMKEEATISAQAILSKPLTLLGKKEPPRSTKPVIVSENHFEGQSRKKILKGRSCENFVLQYEKDFLVKEGYPNLATKVKSVADQIGLGYDILSYEPDGTEKYIEVKSGDNEFFYISDNEVLKSKELSEQYYIYTVKLKQNEIQILKSPEFTDQELSPVSYKVYFR